MIEKFLKAKHWQIFILLCVLPILLQMTLMPLAIIGNNPGDLLKFMPVIVIVYMAGFFGWFWSIAIGLQTKVPAEVHMRINRFKIFLIIPIIYILFFVGLMSSIFGGIIEHNVEPSGTMVGSFVAIIFPLHFFAMFCIFYCLYFVAKTFKTVELQREVTFSDFAGEFFLFWFFPIGVWIVQPKINKMIEEPIGE